MKNLKNILFLTAILALASCTKDEIEAPGDPQPQAIEMEPTDHFSEGEFQEYEPTPEEINDDEDDETGPQDTQKDN